MRTFILIFVCLGALLLLSSCASALEFGGDKELDKLNDEYGGVYVFDKKLREEMIQREKEKKEYSEKTFEYIRSISKGNEEYRANREKYYEVDKKFPQTLSNGCEYFISGNNLTNKGMNFNFKGQKEFEFYENKTREYMGNEIYEKIKPYLGMSSYYQCKDKRYPLTFYTMVTVVKTKYGLFGDEGRGFHLSQGTLVSAGGTEHFYYLVNGKFIKDEETRGKSE